MAGLAQGIARCVPPDELIRHPLHVLVRNGSESYARWQDGMWIFDGHADPYTPEEAAARGWKYLVPRLKDR
jgi:hypothetical protein